jgi:hypothetical protein
MIRDLLLLLLQTNTIERKHFENTPHPQVVRIQNSRVKDAAVNYTQLALELPFVSPAQVSKEGGVGHLVKHNEADRYQD